VFSILRKPTKILLLLALLALLGCDKTVDDTGAPTALEPLSFDSDQARVLAWATLWQPEEVESLDLSLYMLSDESTCPSYQDGGLAGGCTDEFEHQWKGSVAIDYVDEGTESNGDFWSDYLFARQGWGFESSDGDAYEVTGSSETRLSLSAAGTGFSALRSPQTASTCRPPARTSRASTGRARRSTSPTS